MQRCRRASSPPEARTGAEDMTQQCRAARGGHGGRPVLVGSQGWCSWGGPSRSSVSRRPRRTRSSRLALCQGIREGRVGKRKGRSRSLRSTARSLETGHMRCRRRTGEQLTGHCRAGTLRLPGSGRLGTSSTRVCGRDSEGGCPRDGGGWGRPARGTRNLRHRWGPRSLRGRSHRRT